MAKRRSKDAGGESREDGLLIIPATITGGVIRNILRTVFSGKIRRKYQLPVIKTVTFLKTSDVEFMRVDGVQVPFFEACDRLASEVTPGLEVRKHPVADYAHESPQVIMKGVREVGKKNLVLDLTAGKKDVTGSLYTSACIAEIENMIYIEVMRDPETKSFFNLAVDDAHILDKVKLTKFETLGEIENLASLSCMDFVIYKKSVQELLSGLNGTERYCHQFDQAIDNYFQKGESAYCACIREMGLLNEDIVALVGKKLQHLFTDYWPRSAVSPLLGIKEVQQAYEGSSDPKNWRKKDGNLLRQRYNQLIPFFKHFPALFEMLSMVTNYRNLVSHPKDFHARRDDAKLVLDTMLRVFRGLVELDFFNGAGPS